MLNRYSEMLCHQVLIRHKVKVFQTPSPQSLLYFLIGISAPPHLEICQNFTSMIYTPGRLATLKIDFRSPSHFPLKALLMLLFLILQ